MKKKITRKEWFYIYVHKIVWGMVIVILNNIYYENVALNRNLHESFRLYIFDRYIWISMIITIIIGPIGEEVIFREWIYKLLRKRTKYVILIQALLFGLWHLDVFQSFYTCTSGLYYGNLRDETESVWSTILLHGFNNFSSVFFAVRYYDIIDSIGKIIKLQGVALNLLLLIPVIILFLWTLKKTGKNYYRLF